MTSRAGYWIGAALVVIGVAGAILWGVLAFGRIVDTIDAFERVSAPGQATVELEARKYVVYVEGPGVDASNVPPVGVVIRDPARERNLALADYASSLSYALGGHSGVAALTVTPPRHGRYVVAAVTDSGSAEIAIGESIGSSIAKAVAVPLLIGFGLGAAGVGLIVATAIRRHYGGRRSAPAA